MASLSNGRGRIDRASLATLQSDYRDLLRMRPEVDSGELDGTEMIKRLDRFSVHANAAINRSATQLNVVGVTSSVEHHALIASAADLVALLNIGFFEVRDYVATMYPDMASGTESPTLTLRRRSDEFRFTAERLSASLPDPIVSELRAIVGHNESRRFERAVDAVIAKPLPSSDLGVMMASAPIFKLGIDRAFKIVPLIDELVDALDHDANQAALAAKQRTVSTIARAVAAAALTCALAIFIASRITAALVALELRARNISDGVLAAPRKTRAGSLLSEVQVISSTLDDLTANLRSVEAQAAALANGRLDAPELAIEIPGQIGQSLKASIDRLAAATARLDDQARHDDLTGLLNRRALMAELEKALRDARERRGGVAVLFVDLDGFKGVNDRFGHAVGDDLLRAAGRRIAGAISEADVLARLGGDEFVVVVTSCADEQSATVAAERVRASVCEPFSMTGPTSLVAASIGVAWTRDGEIDAETLVETADHHLYAAKSQGRNRVAVGTATDASDVKVATGAG